MKDGLVQQVGTPLELHNKPLNKFVAGFIGTPSMNFLDVVVKKEGRCAAFIWMENLSKSNCQWKFDLLLGALK